MQHIAEPRRSRTPRVIRILRLTVLLGILLGTGTSEAENPCIDYSLPALPPYDSGGGFGSRARTIEVDGDYAFLGLQGSGIYVVDIVDSLNPTFASQAFPSIGGQIEDVEVVGSLLYGVTRAAGDDSLTIFDISTISTPIELGSHVANLEFKNVEVIGSIAYVIYGASTWSGLRLLDVSDPSNPSLLSNVQVGLPLFNDVEVVGNFAFVVGSSGFVVFDVSNPLVAPVQVAYLPLGTPQGTATLDISGGRAYLAGPGSFFIIDISNPLAPVVTGELPILAAAVRYENGRAYLAAYNTSNELHLLNIVDVANPASPVLLKSLALAEVPVDLTIRSDVIYVAKQEQGSGTNGLGNFDVQCNDEQELWVDISKATAQSLLYEEIASYASHSAAVTVVLTPVVSACDAITGPPSLGASLFACHALDFYAAFYLISLDTEIKKIQEDPPDPDYLTVFIPQQYNPPVLAGNPEVPSGTVVAINNGFVGMTDLYEILEAWRITLERYSAAILAGDSAAVALQLAALQNYIEMSSSISDQTESALDLARIALEQLGVVVPVTTQDVQAYQDYVAANGFSSGALSVFATLGATQQEIDDIRDSLLAIDPQSVPGDVLNAFGSTSTALASIGDNPLVPALDLQNATTLALLLGAIGVLTVLYRSPRTLATKS